MTRHELQDAISVRDRMHFVRAYLDPLLTAGWLEMTTPDRPRSPKQRYRTTESGMAALRQWQEGP